MRLFLALLLATALAASIVAITPLEEKNKPMTNGHVLQSQEQEKDHDSRNGHLGNSSREDSLNRWGWLWQAVNKVFIFVLAGWAIGRLAMQFHKLILIFVAFVLVFDFLLVQAGLVEFRLRWENIEDIFQAIKRAILGIGVVQTVSIFLGLWTGIKGFLSAERRQKAATNAA
jgi:hypothetical protein